MHPATDPQNLRQHAYATDEHLNVRYQIHEQYSFPKVDFPKWVLSRAAWRGDEKVLDVGCGPGNYAAALHELWPDVTYYGLDFSVGMLERHPDKRAVLQADVQALPYADDSFDVVMANHMLYHVPDVERAVLECRRVLKPGGVLLAATNSVQSMPEFNAYYKRAILLLTTPGEQVAIPMPTSYPFTLESGVRQLARHFYAVVRHDLPSVFVFDDIEPVMAYLESMRSLREPELPDGIMWDSVMLLVRQQIKNQLNYLGEFIVNKLSGVLVATDRGDFISEFVEQQHRSEV
jgi:SAM-dependent methyltransferase